MEWSAGKLLRNGLVQNVAALYGAHAGSFLLPLVALPYLTRVLGVAGWGRVAVAQAFGWYLNTLVEYGFEVSATRDVARNRDAPQRLAGLLANVTCAKLLLACGAVATAWIVQPLVPVFREYPLLLWAAVFEMAARALSPFWFYMGLERMRFVAGMDLAVKVVALGALFAVVRAPEDGWRVPAIYGAAWLVSTLIGLVWAFRGLPWARPSIRGAIQSLRSGWAIFVSYVAFGIYAAGNSFLLGFFASAESVGYYAGAERIARGLSGTLGPLNRALYPGISRAVHEDAEQARATVRKVIWGIFLFGAAMGLFVLLPAGEWVRLLLGADYAPAAGVLRVIAVLLPASALTSAIGLYWMFPRGMDYAYAGSVALGAAVNIGLACLLAPRYAHMGMAWSLAAAEVIVPICLYVVLRARGADRPLPPA